MARPPLHLSAHSDGDRMGYVRLGNAAYLTLDLAGPDVTAQANLGGPAEAVESCRRQETDRVRVSCHQLVCDLLRRLPPAGPQYGLRPRIPPGAADEERAWELASDRLTVTGGRTRVTAACSLPEGTPDAAAAEALARHLVVARVSAVGAVYSALLRDVLAAA